MKKSIVLFLAFSCLLFSCKMYRQKSDKQKPHKHELKISREECNHEYDTMRFIRSNDERLNRHFLQHQIQPKIVINNIEGNETDIALAEHHVKWLKTQDETFISIDDNKVSLKNKITINEVANLNKDSVADGKNWRQIKLYKYLNREIISIETVYEPFSYDSIKKTSSLYILYDTKTNATNYFGAYNPKQGMNLYDFGGGSISFVSQSFMALPSNFENIYTLYTLDKNGAFNQRLNKGGKPYEIRHYYDDDIIYFEHLEQDNWIKKIK